MDKEERSHFRFPEWDSDQIGQITIWMRTLLTTQGDRKRNLFNFCHSSIKYLGPGSGMENSNPSKGQLSVESEQTSVWLAENLQSVMLGLVLRIFSNSFSPCLIILLIKSEKQVKSSQRQQILQVPLDTSSRLLKQKWFYRREEWGMAFRRPLWGWGGVLKGRMWDERMQQERIQMESRKMHVSKRPCIPQSYSTSCADSASDLLPLANSIFKAGCVGGKTVTFRGDETSKAWADGP